MCQDYKQSPIHSGQDLHCKRLPEICKFGGGVGIANERWWTRIISPASQQSQNLAQAAGFRACTLDATSDPLMGLPGPVSTYACSPTH